MKDKLSLEADMTEQKVREQAKQIIQYLRTEYLQGKNEKNPHYMTGRELSSILSVGVTTVDLWNNANTLPRLESALEIIALAKTKGVEL